MKRIFLSTESTSLDKAVQKINDACIELKTGVRVNKSNIYCRDQIPAIIHMDDRFVYTFETETRSEDEVLSKEADFSRLGVGVSEDEPRKLTEHIRLSDTKYSQMISAMQDLGLDPTTARTAVFTVVDTLNKS